MNNEPIKPMSKFDRELLERAQNEVILLKNIKKNLPALKKLHKEVCSMWGYEDFIYRFYHYSIKIFHRYGKTREIVDALKNLAPEGVELNKMFLEIFDDGASGKEHQSGEDWVKQTRPIVEAFLHAKFFLDMAVKYGRILKKPESALPSGWAALLYLYNLR